MLPEFADEKSAKYYNTTDTPLFSKSHLLYGLDVARQYIHKKFDDTALVMEGYTDVIMAHQHGFENAVAVLGTALGEQHVKILKRFAKRVVLVLDGDQAGQDRANQVLELFIAQDLDLQVLTLPDGSDPCDYLQDARRRGFPAALGHRSGRRLGTCPPCGRPRHRLAKRRTRFATGALESMLSVLAKVPQRDETAQIPRADKILKRLALGFGISEDDIRQRLIATAPRGPPAVGHAASEWAVAATCRPLQTTPMLSTASWLAQDADEFEPHFDTGRDSLSGSRPARRVAVRVRAAGSAG